MASSIVVTKFSSCHNLLAVVLNIFAILTSTIRLTDCNNMVLELLVMIPITRLFCFIIALVDMSIEN